MNKFIVFLVFSKKKLLSNLGNAQINAVKQGAQWRNGRVLGLGSKGPKFETPVTVLSSTQED